MMAENHLEIMTHDYVITMTQRRTTPARVGNRLAKVVDITHLFRLLLHCLHVKSCGC